MWHAQAVSRRHVDCDSLAGQAVVCACESRVLHCAGVWDRALRDSGGSSGSDLGLPPDGPRRTHVSGQARPLRMNTAIPWRLLHAQRLSGTRGPVCCGAVQPHHRLESDAASGLGHHQAFCGCSHDGGSGRGGMRAGHAAVLRLFNLRCTRMPANRSPLLRDRTTEGGQEAQHILSVSHSQESLHSRVDIGSRVTSVRCVTAS